MAQISYSYNEQSLSFSNTTQKLTFKAGDRVPYLHEGFLNNFKESVFHLIRISNTEASQTETLDIKSCFPFEIKVTHYTISDQWKRFGVLNDLYILVRPDHYILFLGDTLDKTVVKHHLEKYFN